MRRSIPSERRKRTDPLRKLTRPRHSSQLAELPGETFEDIFRPPPMLDPGWTPEAGYAHAANLMKATEPKPGNRQGRLF